jgi:hypothetical protein
MPPEMRQGVLASLCLLRSSLTLSGGRFGGQIFPHQGQDDISKLFFETTGIKIYANFELIPEGSFCLFNYKIKNFWGQI